MTDTKRWLPLVCGSLALVLGTACDINVNDDDDGDGDGAGTGADDDGPSASDGADDGDGNADGTGSDDNGDAPDDNGDAPDDNGDAPDDNGDAPDDSDDSGPVDGDPPPGLWLYTETGGASSTCDFLGPNPSNGFGEYQVASLEGGGWQVVPGDGTAPFSCATSSGSFECDERLQDSISSGRSTIEVLVGITGELPSAGVMTGTQHGAADCDGPDCALAEQLLGTSFPCAFEIPFEGTKL